MTEWRQKVCSSCGAAFECAAGGCWCDDVPLTASMRTALRENYADCVCAACLRAVIQHSDLLMVQFLRWVAERPRTYADVMEAWQTSCPRQSVWEDAQIDNLVERAADLVTLTPRGRAVLAVAAVGQPSHVSRPQIPEGD